MANETLEQKVNANALQEKKEEKPSESAKEVKIVGEAAPLTKVEEKLPETNKLVEQYQTPSGRTEFMFKHDYSKYKR